MGVGLELHVGAQDVLGEPVLHEEEHLLGAHGPALLPVAALQVGDAVPEGLVDQLVGLQVGVCISWPPKR